MEDEGFTEKVGANCGYYRENRGKGIVVLLSMQWQQYV